MMRISVGQHHAVFLTGLCALCLPAFAAPTYNTGSVSDLAAASASNLVAITPTAGDVILVGLRYSSDTNQVSSVTGNSNTFVLLCHSATGTGGGNGSSLTVYYAIDVNAGSTQVVANNNGTVPLRAVVAAYSGVSDTAPIEDDSSSAGACTQVESSTTATTPSVTTTGTDRLIVGIQGNVGNAVAPNSGETERQEAASRVQIQDEAAATAGGYTSSWVAASQDWAVVAIALTDGSAPSSGLLLRRRR